MDTRKKNIPHWNTDIEVSSNWFSPKVQDISETDVTLEKRALTCLSFPDLVKSWLIL